MVDVPERIWAASVTENYGEWQTTTDGLPRPTEYIRADLVTARCSSCDGTGDVHRPDGEWLGECDCRGEFRHAFDVEANSSKAYRVIQSQAARIAALEAQLAERVKVKPLEWRERVGVDGTFDAYTSIGHYIATITDDDRGMWFAVGLTQSNYCAPDIDIAKAAAQADYESRILSALEATPPVPKVTEEFKQYRRKQVAELRPWSPGECMDGVSVSGEDAKAGSPKLGDMIARNPKNHDDKWLVAATYFADNFEPLPALTVAQEAGKP